MVYTILVSGLLEYDSGKTWLVVGLAKLLKEMGYSVRVFKPVAGHNFWQSYNAVHESLRKGILVGNDILIYEKYLGLENPHMVNPIDILLSYPDPLAMRGPSEYYAAISNIKNMVLMARITSCKERKTKHYLFERNLLIMPMYVREKMRVLAEKLDSEPAEPEVILNYLASPNASNLLEECREELGRGADILLIESFSDSVIPYVGVEKSVDLFILVAPGKAMVFTGEKLRQALEILGISAPKASSFLAVARSSTLLVEELPPARDPAELSGLLRLTRLVELVA
ncbi:hypothetical protein PYJP_09500 [Pyrofollis japonicus]|uniref:hypothetical protein n=1 Tax=Pyrofollis japonicus TaxID=3060460 RepID=UPI00295BAB7C|nr:hypothetical protein [Pyrofollis japonicus]BEP17598.1 hypothetical protein PYJP_09500 [Pyrofollis japonicus]